MINTETYFVEEEKKGKKLVELSCNDYRHFLLLSPSEINLLNFLKEEEYFDYECRIEIIDEVGIKEF